MYIFLQLMALQVLRSRSRPFLDNAGVAPLGQAPAPAVLGSLKKTKVV